MKIQDLLQRREHLTQTLSDLKRELEEIEEQLFQYLSDLGVDKISVADYNLELKEALYPKIEDWDALCDHIRDTDSFWLLHRRLSVTAVRELVELDGAPPPGVSVAPVKKLSITKRR